MISPLETLVAALEQDRSLDAPDRLRQRIEALDRLEAHLPADGQGQGDWIQPATDVALRSRASAVRARLESHDDALYQSIRADIRRGAAPAGLLQWLPKPDRGDSTIQPLNGDGYDFLDVLASGVLRFEPPGVTIAGLSTEMVPYQPTPARHILDLIARAALTAEDVFVDLGSGLGHVPLLVSSCTGAHSIGIEREPAYVRCARHCAEALNLGSVTFIEQDARHADFSSGTVFYLYTPFKGAILRTVLDGLRRQSVSRAFRVCTYGPCTIAIARERWLQPVGSSDPDRVAIFRTRN